LTAVDGAAAAFGFGFASGFDLGFLSFRAGILVVHTTEAHELEEAAEPRHGRRCRC
jgi:hypothetical protein